MFALGQTRGFSRHCRPQVPSSDYCKNLGTRLFRAKQNGGWTCNWSWSTSRYISPRFGVSTGLKVPQGNKISTGSKWLSLWPWWRLDILYKSSEWSDSSKLATRVRESVHLQDMETCPIEPFQPPLKQPMAESQGEWMTIIRVAATLLTWSRFPNVDSFWPRARNLYGGHKYRRGHTTQCCSHFTSSFFRGQLRTYTNIFYS